MSPRTMKLLLAGWIMVVLAMFGMTIYYTIEIKQISLPISQIYAYSALALPVVTCLATFAVSRVRSKLSRLTANQQTLLFLVITILQSIYETVIATLAVKYMSPNCSLEEQWKALYIRKDSSTIRRIQDRFDCCGFNTVVDRAWPFPRGRPEDGHGADQCRRMFGRETACGAVWKVAQTNTSWVFLCLAGSVFILQVLFLIWQIFTIERTHPAGWVRFLSQNGNGGFHESGLNSPSASRGLIGQGESAVEQERYRDNAIDGEQRENTGPNDQASSRPRVEPSGLAVDNSEGHWNNN